ECQCGANAPDGPHERCGTRSRTIAQRFLQLFLRFTRTVRQLGLPRWLRAVLAADCGGCESDVDAVLRSRPLGLYRLRLVLGVGLFLGLGAVPLWALVPQCPLRLVLG